LLNRFKEGPRQFCEKIIFWKKLEVKGIWELLGLDPEALYSGKVGVCNLITLSAAAL
jgi:hypothetical protein